jgi:hypothetical protein
LPANIERPFARWDGGERISETERKTATLGLSVDDAERVTQAFRDPDHVLDPGLSACDLPNLVETRGEQGTAED